MFILSVLALYLSVFVCAVAFPIAYLSIDPTPQNLAIVMTTGFIVASFGVLLTLFFPKIYLILRGAQVDENMDIVRRKGSSQSAMSIFRSHAKSRLRSSASRMNSSGHGGLIRNLSSRAISQVVGGNFGGPSAHGNLMLGQSAHGPNKGNKGSLYKQYSFREVGSNEASNLESSPGLNTPAPMLNRTMSKRLVTTAQLKERMMSMKSIADDHVNA